MRTKRIGIYFAAAALAAMMMSACGGAGQTTEQLAAPKAGTEQSGVSGSGEDADAGQAQNGSGDEGLGGNGKSVPADGIKGQVQAPDRYETELSKGALTVRADAEVFLPEGEGFLQYKVTGRPFAQEDLDKVKKALLKDAPLWTRDADAMEGSHGFTRSEIEERIEELKGRAAGNQGTVVKDGTEETYGDKITMWQELLASAPEEPVIREVAAVVPYVKKMSPEEDTMEENILEGNATVDGEDYWLVLNNNFQSDWLWAQMDVSSVKRSVGNAYVELDEASVPSGLSIEQVRESAAALVKEMGFSDFAPAGEEYFQAFSADEEADETIPGAVGYGIHFTRVLDGIPETYTHEQGLTVDGDKAAWPYERLDLVFDEEGLTDFVWVNPCEVEKRSGEYVFLMPFSDIQDIFEEMIFQKYGWLSQSGDVTVSFDIDEVRLGYMRVRDDSGAGEGSMVPVWDFFGRQTLLYADEIEAKIASGELIYEDGEILSASGEPAGPEDMAYVAYGSYESLLTIDATSGKVIDRGIGR